MKEERWAGDSSITWSIGIRAQLTQPVPAAELRDRWHALARTYPHLGTVGEVESRADDTTLEQLLSERFTGGRVLRIAADRHRLVVVAEHTAVDGLGLLAVLAALTASDVRSLAQGLGARRAKPFAIAGAMRLWEAIVAPPTAVSASGVRDGPEVVATSTLQRQLRTAAVVAAVGRAVAGWNTARDQPGQRLTIAVGATRASRAIPTPDDDSSYLRIRNVEALSEADIARALRTAAPEPRTAEGVRVSGALANVVAWLSRRLGSTVLVSHLGQVEGDAVRSLEFYPVTGGRSGVSVGAASVGDQTTITMRARGGEHTPADLGDLLGQVVDELAAGDAEPVG